MAIETDARTLPAKHRAGAITRRAVLGAAIAGGAGVAAVRLLGLNQGAAPALGQRINGGTDWISPLGNENARVMQLLRRATFGASPADLERALGDGYQKTLDRLVSTPAVKPPVLPGADDASRSAPIKVAQLQKWWLDHMLATPTPFAERMTMFWHGHFTSDYRKVGLQNPFIYWQNLTWRDNALGDFRNFLYQVTIDPGMLRYLDLGTSTGQAPNENYARELMELFTMGAGNFSEDDVRAAAKALAGWREPRTAGMVMDAANNPNATAAQKAAAGKAPADASKVGIFVSNRAYGYRDGPVTFLGKTAKFDTKAALAQVIAQKATAPFIVKRVLVNFVMPNPPGATVNRLAAGFVKSGWSIRQLMHDVFGSDEFKSASSYRSLVKQPVELMVHGLRALNAHDQSAVAMRAASGMGQNLFDPPDVGGWPLNEAWVSSNTVMARVNFVTGLLAAVKSLPPATDAHLHNLDGVLSPATANLLNAASTDLDRWLLILASPEFQLK
ncbi:MAG: DUF1800 domain-containing protein [Candidatus Dormibacteraeota bacterium]|nr:DUF1800 domain-containing protein [Candidatus Dormibacteraeota bacterium]